MTDAAEERLQEDWRVCVEAALKNAEKRLAEARSAVETAATKLNERTEARDAAQEAVYELRHAAGLNRDGTEPKPRGRKAGGDQ